MQNSHIHGRRNIGSGSVQRGFSAISHKAAVCVTCRGRAKLIISVNMVISVVGYQEFEYATKNSNLFSSFDIKYLLTLQFNLEMLCLINFSKHEC